MFSKILVPIDGSETAWNALEYARTLGDKFGGSISVIHVVKPAHTVSMNGDVPYVPQNIAEIENVGRNLLKFAQEKMKDYPGTVGAILDFGNPANRILYAAKEQGFDSIVIGCRGLSGLAEFFLGNVSSAVAQHSPVPVLIVK